MAQIRAKNVKVGQTIQYPNQDILFNSFEVEYINTVDESIIFIGRNKDTGKSRGLRVESNKVLNLI